MKLPNYTQARVPQEKLVEYLLSASHPDGSSKAGFFLRFGFTVNEWYILAKALVRHAAEHEVAAVEASPFGTRYVVEGIIITPDRRNPNVRAVWFIESGEEIPRF